MRHPCKQSIYLPQKDLAQIEAEGKRLDRSGSWLVQRAWLLARDTIRSYPGIPAPIEPQPGPAAKGKEAAPSLRVSPLGAQWQAHLQERQQG